MAVDPSRFNISLRDLKRDCVERMLHEVVSRDMNRSKMASKSAEDDEEEVEDPSEIEESENDKLVALQQDTKGKPAPLPVSDEDFSESAVKAAMKKVPMPAAKKRSKA